MIILGIDPGYDRFGVAVVGKIGGKEKLLYSDCVVTNRKDDLGKRLFEISGSLQKIIDEYRPDKIAIERIFFSKNVKTAGAVAEARGVVLAKASENNTPVVEYTPGEIKVAITSYGKSDKKQVAFMLGKLLPIKKLIKYDDEYDAIAVALTCLYSDKDAGR